MLHDILSKGEPVREVLEKFSNFFTQESIIWSHATFDFVIVQNYLKTLNLTTMHYRSARDLRTLVDLSGINLDNYDWSRKTHNALDDCKFQIKYTVDALNML